MTSLSPGLFSVNAAPFVQVTDLSSTGESAGQIDLSWVAGDGEKTIVFFKQVATNGTTVPVDNTTYTANTVFGSGTQIGSSGYYCVYNGTGASVTVTGLTQGAEYDVIVFSYIGNPGFESYLSTLTVGANQGVFTAFEAIGGAEDQITVNVFASADAFMQQGAPTTNAGTGSIATLAGTAPEAMRPIFRFTFAPLVPNNVTIVQAQLYLCINSLTPGLSVLSEATGHRVEVGKSFVENQVTWNIYSTGNSWATPGGDLDPSDETTPFIFNVGTNQVAGTFDVVDVTDQFSTSYYALLASFDFILYGSTWPTVGGFKTYRTREFSTTTFDPRIEVIYLESSTSPAVTFTRIPVSKISRIVRSR